MAASGQVDGAALAGWEFAGELSLSGELRPVRGALAMGLVLSGLSDPGQLVLPQASAEEAALVPDTAVYGARHLLDVVQRFAPPGEAAPDTPAGWARVATQPVGAVLHHPDLSDVKGQASAKRALEIAAAGGHSVLMVGPPGSGKSMLAQRFAGLLPPMSPSEALESAAIASLAGRFSLDRWAVRPMTAPHHTASAVALVDGGSPPRPGEISLAHHGVLFLDELVECGRAPLEALREPLETGVITISRAARRAEFPARFQLIAAMNPCPCGHQGSPLNACRCTPDQVLRYQGKLSGPLLDRIDLQVVVPAVRPDDLLGAPRGEPSAVVQQRVVAARQRAMDRQGCPNHALQGQQIDDHVAMDAATRQFLQQAATRLGWSARGTHRVLKLARTVADLAGSTPLTVGHLAEAIQYRRALEVATRRRTPGGHSARRTAARPTASALTVSYPTAAHPPTCVAQAGGWCGLRVRRGPRRLVPAGQRRAEPSKLTRAPTAGAVACSMVRTEPSCMRTRTW